MGSIIKRGARYYVRVYVNGQPVERSAKTADRRVAEAMLRQLELEKARATGRPGGIGPTRTELVPAIEAFVSYLQTHLRAKSATVEVSRLRTIFGDISPKLRPPRWEIRHGDVRPTIMAVAHVEDITVGLVETWLDQRRKLVSANTCNKERELLVRFVQWCISRMGVRFRLPVSASDPNPLRAVRIRRTQRAPIRYLQVADIDRQLDALSDYPELRMAAALMILAGLRREEVTWLTPNDIETDAIRIAAHQDAITGEHWQPKGGKNRRVPISASLRAEIDRYGDQVATSRWFLEHRPGRRWLPDNLASAIRSRNEKHKPPLPWNCLDFRHTFASHLLQMGYSAEHIADWMGNSAQMVRDHYGNIEGPGRRTDVDFLARRSASAK